MKQTSFERRRFLHLGFAACAGMALWQPARAQTQGEVTAHVLPSGGLTRRDDSLLAYRDFGAVTRRIDAAHAATSAYLAEHL